jgi:hypothetical protein
MGGDSQDKYETIKEEYLKSADVLAVTASSRLPLSGGDSSSNFDWEGKESGQEILINTVAIDPNYINVMGMRLIEGEEIRRSQTSSENGQPVDIIINENAVERMNMQSPVGKLITSGSWRGRIVGVVKDFHFASFHREKLNILRQHGTKLIRACLSHTLF